MADNERYYLSHKCENKRCYLFFLTMVIVIDSDINRLRITGLHQVMVTFWCAGQKLALWFLVIE